MKLNRTVAGAVWLLGQAAATGALADSGTIVVTGQLHGQNCRINGNAQGSVVDVDVTLPTVSRTALSVAGSTAGLKRFSIALTECPAGTYSIYFEANPSTTNLQTGALVNTSTGGGAAANVEVQLLNDVMQPIHIVTNANSQSITAVDGAATFNYYMRYISLGGATAGAFTSRLGYTLAYN